MRRTGAPMLIDHAILPGMNGRFAPEAAIRKLDGIAMFAFTLVRTSLTSGVSFVPTGENNLR